MMKDKSVKRRITGKVKEKKNCGKIDELRMKANAKT